MLDTCVICGSYVSEGTMVCKICYNNTMNKKSIIKNKEYNKEYNSIEREKGSQWKNLIM